VRRGSGLTRFRIYSGEISLSLLGWSTGFSASVTEGHAGQFLLDALAFGGVGGFSEPGGEGEKLFLLGGFGFQAGFNQIDEDAVGAGLPRFSDGPDVLDDMSWDGNALANEFIGFGHIGILHQNAPFCTTTHRWQTGRLQLPSRAIKKGALVIILATTVGE
jgi:hypothetical protein